jgi:hypothetical protein
MANLTEDDFEVAENGVPQEIQNFEAPSPDRQDSVDGPKDKGSFVNTDKTIERG